MDKEKQKLKTQALEATKKEMWPSVDQAHKAGWYLRTGATPDRQDKLKNERKHARQKDEGASRPKKTGYRLWTEEPKAAGNWSTPGNRMSW
jgi:hypothetical protein